MDLQRIIAELEAEKNRLDEAIIALERLSSGNGKRRDRSLRSAKDVSGEPGQPTPDLENTGPAVSDPGDSN